MIRIGTQGWSYKDWLGNFYPEKSKQIDFLSIYAEKFDTVEIDSTFYAIPRVSTVQRWYGITPDNFKFSAKFPKAITHESNLTGIESILSAYLRVISELKEKLGPLLIQFPYSFKPDQSENLYKFLRLLPKEFTYILEIRNKKWLSNKFYEQLKNNNIGLAILDHPWMPKISELTSKTLYMRFLGDRKKIADNFSFERTERSKELKDWKQFLNSLIEQAEDSYFYFNNHYSGHSPTTAERFIKILSDD